MKINIEFDLTPEEFQELFVPGEQQQEFMVAMYDAYTSAFQKFFKQQIDPNGVIFNKGEAA